MHHVALDRARAHDRNLDHQVVEILRLQSRQHRHLRAALDLEHADRVGARQHRVDFRRVRRAVFRDARQRKITAVMGFEKIEPTAQAAQHAERAHVDLHQADGVDVVLVPFDEGALGHGGVGDRHRVVEPAAGEDETADVLGEVAREAGQCVGERDGLADRRVLRVEAGLANVIVRQFIAVPPHRFGKRCGDVLGQPQCLADFADGAPGAIVNDGRADRGAMAAVASVNVLDHFLAPLVLEIDVDVGRLVAVRRDEAGEQQFAFVRIDLGDAEAKAHRAVRRRAAALAQDL